MQSTEPRKSAIVPVNGHQLHLLRVPALWESFPNPQAKISTVNV